MKTELLTVNDPPLVKIAPLFPLYPVALLFKNLEFLISASALITTGAPTATTLSVNVTLSSVNKSF